MPSRQSPTIRRRRLGSELRRLREAAGLTIEQVAQRMECSDSTISRIEKGQVGTKPRDARILLDIYKVSGREREELLQIASEARQKGWWHEYRDLPVAYIGFEAAATSIRYYQDLVIPGLFQLKEYAVAVLSAVHPEFSVKELQRWVDVRMARQSLVAQEDAPTLHTVLDESVLRRPMGGREVMLRQLEHLAEEAARPNVTLQVLPFSAGEHAGIDGAFSILSFSESRDPDVVYLEATGSNLYLEEKAVVQQYNKLFRDICNKAMTKEESLPFMARLSKEL